MLEYLVTGRTQEKTQYQWRNEKLFWVPGHAGIKGNDRTGSVPHHHSATLASVVIMRPFMYFQKESIIKIIKKFKNIFQILTIIFDMNKQSTKYSIK